MSGVSLRSAFTGSSFEAVDFAVAVEAHVDDALLLGAQERANVGRNGRLRICQQRARREHPFDSIRGVERRLELGQCRDERCVDVQVAPYTLTNVALILVAAAAQPEV